MHFLSNAFQVTEEDLREGRVKDTRKGSGESFDWANALGEFLHGEVSDVKPVGARLVVSHLGHWFYIDDSDLETKSTFALLAQIFTLQAGKAEGIVPVPTLLVAK